MYHCRAANKPSFKRLFPSSVRACKMQFAKIVNKYIDMVLFVDVHTEYSPTFLFPVWLPAWLCDCLHPSLLSQYHLTSLRVLLPVFLPVFLSASFLLGYLHESVSFLPVLPAFLSPFLALSTCRPAFLHLLHFLLTVSLLPLPSSHSLLPSLLPCSLCIIADKPWMIWVHVWPVQTSFFCLIEYYTVEVREINKICFNH